MTYVCRIFVIKNQNLIAVKARIRCFLHEISNYDIKFSIPMIFFIYINISLCKYLKVLFGD